MEEAVSELKQADMSYRDSLPDITHHHLKLLASPKLWAAIMTRSVKSWKIRDLIDQKSAERLVQKRVLALIYWLLGLLPFLGNFIRRLGGHAVYRQHYKGFLMANVS